MESKKVKLSSICVALVLLSFALSAKAQEIPPDVNYKRATEEINAAAKSTLERALASQTTSNDFLGEVFVCGPMLWKVLKPAADQALLAGKPVVAIIQNPEVIHAQARSFLKPDEKQSFWKLLREKYPALSSGEVRKAHADEISLYWAEIPFDIEEPFFVVETKAERFVVHLQHKDGKDTLFWIELVGDLRSLKAK
jgi:hypothetical protein